MADFVPDDESGFVPDEAETPAPPPVRATPGLAAATARGAVQGASLGFGDEISAGVDTLLSKIPLVRTVAEKINGIGGEGAGLPIDNPNLTYAQRRDSYRAANQSAQTAHPVAYGAGELAGGIAATPGVGSAIGESGNVLARGFRAATGAGGGNVIDRALLGGAVSGLGTSNATNAIDTARDVATGGAASALLGGALHAAGSALAKRAPAAFEKDLTTEVFGKAKPKDSEGPVAFIKKNPAEFKEIAYSPDFQAVQKAVRAGHTDEAIGEIKSFVNQAGSQRLANYKALEDSGYQTTPGPVVDRIEKLAAAKAATSSPEEAKALKDAADRVRNEFSTLDTAQVKEGDTAEAQAFAAIKPYLPPNRATVTKAEIQDAAVKASGGKNYGDVPNAIHQAIEGLPFSYNPNAPVGLVQLRKAATAAQNATHATLGSIAETEHFRIVKGVDDAINAGLDAHLDGAAQVSPAARRAVEAIRHDNKILSMGLSMQTALEQRLDKESRGKVLTTGQKIGNAVKVAAGAGAGAGYLLHSPLAAGAVAAAPVAGFAVRRGQDTLARLVQAAQQGNPWAQRALAAARQGSVGVGRTAAMQIPQSPQVQQ